MAFHHCVFFQGGYIEGKLEFDPELLHSPFGLKITLVSGLLTV